LKFLGEAPSGGRGPCHLALHPAGSVLAVANYGNGNMSLLELDGQGLPSPLNVISKTGSGPSPRQEGPHSHGVYFDRSGQLLLEPDLGVDKVLMYQFVGKPDRPSTTSFLATEPGAGPRHLAFSPDEKYIYVINEFANTIQVAKRGQPGQFETIQTISTLPEGFTDKNSTAEIETHPNGKFVYGSNRGHDSIVVFARDAETGKLTFLQHAPCGGKIPRHFKIDPSGKWLLCGHQGSNGISVLALDPEKGTLGAPSAPVSAPSPACIVFGR